MSNVFLSRLRACPVVHDHSRAARVLEALGAGVPPDGWTQLVRATASNSPYLSRALERDPAWVMGLRDTVPEEAMAGQIERLAGVVELPRQDAMRVLREVKHHCALIIALADLGGVWSLDEVTSSLTQLADETLKAALAHAVRDAVERGRLEAGAGATPGSCGLFFLAMGKYGAFELNYSSDIDFSCYFNPERLPVTSRYSPQEVAVRITQATVSLMQEQTQDGYVFRCDLRLRPDAGSTQIAVSTTAAETYYESMGQNWERAAMIKARVCAGDAGEGDSFLRNLQPFIWRKYLDYAAIEDIHSIKRQIHAHGGFGDIAVAGHNIKLGRGGIREIEFFAQTQQLILGGRIPTLRNQRTTDALDALTARNVIAVQTCEDLKRAYVFLRTLEHRLQMIEDEQTHSMPRTADGLENVAHFMGLPDTAALSECLSAQLAIVQGHYVRLFESQPTLSEQAGSLVFTGVDDDPETIATLRNMGFSQPEAVSATIRGWHHGRVRATRSERAREKLTALMPLLLDALAKTANPDIAFTRFDRFLSGLPSGVQVFALLLSNPELLRLIAEIVGTAPRLADHLAARPGLLDVLIDSEFLRHTPDLRELKDSLDALVRSSRRLEDTLDTVRRWTKDQQFRIGLQLLRKQIDGLGAGHAFADVAQAAILALFAACLSELVVAHGRVPGAEMCVIGMGRLGGREMTATSDLDLIFVYESPPEVTASDGERPLSASVYFSRLSQRLITALTAMTAEGGLYEVDMRLRPSGNKGPVAVSFETFRNYQMNEAWTWERLAMTRARILTAPSALGARVAGVIAECLTAGHDRAKILADVADMRHRLDRERPARSPWDLKEAKGGLFDIEFIAQGLQLVSAPQSDRVLQTNTLDALAALERAQALSTEDARVLADSLIAFQNLIQILRLTVGEALASVEMSASLRSLIAETVGLSSLEEVEAMLRVREAQVRARFERLIGGAPDS
ncbi:MAG: bifunctional [glutamine synthetase] adenylyltransferase/[glutamine synthetase]-adenylyl-L-tyrosine phosphorylase [Alphaproteobacteria bacterium]